ncbi:MAG: SusC/RagA family TonB-linked outer membrane protein [Bacteroidota bacterium]
MKKQLLTKLLLLSFLLCGSMAMAQSVSGTVSDTTGPLPGASVLVKGTDKGTQTNFDGQFTLDNMTNGDVIVFSYVGYKAQEITYTGQPTIDVTLESDTDALKEVVIIGYGSTTVRDATGAVATVKAEEFNRGIFTSPNELIQGNVTGVQVTQASGEPGASSSIRIRGIGSPRAGNDPLIVVDGVALNNAIQGAGGEDLGFGTSTPRNPLSFINPNDIETLTVLKDASATAIYGSRASNGVILVTTKKGKSGKPRLDFSTSFAVATLRNAPDVLTGSEHAALTNQIGGTPAGNADINGIDEITRTAISQTYDASFAAGNDKSNYRLSLGMQNLEGIVDGTGQDRYTANFSGKLRFFEDDKLTVSTNIQVSGINDQFQAISNNAGFEGSLIGAALQWNPTRPLFNPDGSYNQFSDTEPNPVAFQDFYNDNAETTRIVGNLTAEYKITNDLSYKMLFGVDRFLSTRRSSLSPDFNLQGNFGIGVASVVNLEAFSKTFTHTLNYTKQFSDKINFNALLGYEAVLNRRSGSTIVARGFDSDPGNLTDFLAFATQRPTISSFDDPTDDLQSFFTRAEIGYDGKYILTVNFRVDGASKFGENNRYGYYPSAAFAWNIDQEDFMPDSFDLLKLRLGYGQVGNSNFPAGASLEQFNFFVGTDGNSASQQFNAFNPNLQWEVVTNYNVGVDFGILDNKLTGTVEYFHRETQDLLFQVAAPAPAPDGLFSWTNLPGKVINNGVELSLNYQVIDNEDWSFDVTTNMSFLNNDVRDTGFGPNAVLIGATNGQGGGVPVQRIADGQPLFAYYLPIFTGYDANGLPTYQDINGDGNGTTDLVDRTFVGDPNPDFLIGLRLAGRYKNWDLTANLNGAYGHEIFNNTDSALLGVRSAFPSRNVSADLDVLNIDAGATNAASTQFLESGDFLRLTSLSLGYNVDLGETEWINSLRFTLTGQNLFVITPYSGFDPEVNTVQTSPEGVPSFGIEYTPYPSASTFSLGINASF